MRGDAFSLTSPLRGISLALSLATSIYRTEQPEASLGRRKRLRSRLSRPTSTRGNHRQMGWSKPARTVTMLGKNATTAHGRAENLMTPGRGSHNPLAREKGQQ